MTPAAPQLTLTIDPGSEPISGQIHLPDGTRAAFEGYVQLIAALEELRLGSATAKPTPPGEAAAPRT